jgi:hypothetical protein
MNRRTTISRGRVLLIASTALCALAACDRDSGKSELALRPPQETPAGEYLSTAAAESQRSQHYQGVGSIDAIRRLPTRFARMEALYVVAGRSDAAQLRTLIRDAQAIASENERLETLEVLLFRFVELDPPAALASLRSMDRTAVAALTPIVIAAWSRMDLAAAVGATKALTDPALKRRVAHALLVESARGKPDEVRRLAQELDATKDTDDALFEARAGRSLDDPYRALADAARLAPEEQRTEIVKIARAWASIAPEEAWDHVAQLTDAKVRTLFQNAVIDQWSADQPERAFDRVLELPDDWQRTQLLQQVLAEFGAREPLRALELITARNLPNNDELKATVIQQWAREDAPGAAQWIEGKDPQMQGRFAFAIGNAYVTQTPDEALAWALRISRSPGRNLWSSMLGTYATQNPQEALRIALAAESSVQRTQALSQVIGAIAQRDPALAYSQLDKLPAGDQRRNLVGQIATRFAQRSPDAAFEWMLGLNNPEDKRSASRQVAYGMAEADIERAGRLLERVPNDLRQMWAGAVANRYGNTDVEKGVQWTRRFQDEPNYNRVALSFIQSVAMQSPDTIVDVIDRVTVEGKQRDMLIQNAIQTAGFQAPEAASKWIAAIQDDRMRAGAVSQVAGAWSRNDPAGARKWVMTLDRGAARDAGLVQIAETVTSVDDVASLLSQIQSQESREGAVFNAAVRMTRDDPEAARTLLRRYPLSPQQQQSFDQMVKRQGRW